METFKEILPEITTSLNLLSAVFIVRGVYFIRRKNRDAHKRSMLTAVALSALFLVFYLTRSYLTGTHPFPGEGWVRTLYFSILIPHTILAAVVVPFVLVTVTRALRGNFAKHRRIGRWTVPIWLFVSVTGPIIYVMLYRISY